VWAGRLVSIDLYDVFDDDAAILKLLLICGMKWYAAIYEAKMKLFAIISETKIRILIKNNSVWSAGCMRVTVYIPSMIVDGCDDRNLYQNDLYVLKRCIQRFVYNIFAIVKFVLLFLFV
jgi:hypothetical protein